MHENDGWEVIGAATIDFDRAPTPSAGWKLSGLGLVLHRPGPGASGSGSGSRRAGSRRSGSGMGGVAEPASGASAGAWDAVQLVGGGAPVLESALRAGGGAEAGGGEAAGRVTLSVRWVPPPRPPCGAEPAQSSEG
eukprot:COSAG01_NODE_12183_length_1781_cov_1.703440_3_plen_136_part_00